MSATSVGGGGLLTSQLQKTHHRKNHESHGRVCVLICACTVNLHISLNVHCSFVHFDWWLFFFFSSVCRKGSNPTRFQAAYWRQTIKPLADINGRDENPGAISAGTALQNLPLPALHFQQHLSLSIIWLLSQQINQITAPGLCAAAPIAPLVALALKCMRSTFYHRYLFNAAPSPASHLTTTAKFNH